VQLKTEVNDRSGIDRRRLLSREDRDSALEQCGSLMVGRAGMRGLAGANQEFERPRGPSRLQPVVSQQFGPNA